MTIAGLDAVIMADQKHLAVAVDCAHLFNHAIASGIDCARALGGVIDARMGSRAVMARAEP